MAVYFCRNNLPGIFGRFYLWKWSIKMIKVPIPAVPDLKIKFEVNKARIADTTDNNKTP